MAEKVLSVVIGPECTKVCEVSYVKKYKNKSIRVYGSITFPNPPDTIEDGYIKDIELFGAELGKQLKLGDLKADKVIFTISSSKIINRSILLPAAGKKKLTDIIAGEASEYLQTDTRGYLFSCSVPEGFSGRRMKAQEKKFCRQELKLAKRNEKISRKAQKKKSRTEIIAEKMELLEARSVMNPDDMMQHESGGIPGREDKRQMRISVYGIPVSLAKNYYRFAGRMKLNVVSLDCLGNSCYQILRRQINRGTNVFILLNEHDTLVSILHNNTLILQKTVAYGSSMLAEALLEQDFYQANTRKEALGLFTGQNLLADKYNSNLQMDAAKNKLEILLNRSEAFLKRTSATVNRLDALLNPDAAASLDYMAAQENEDQTLAKKEQQARAKITESLRFLTGSVGRILADYKADRTNEEINHIYISGPGMRIKGIDKFFTDEIGITHTKLEQLRTVNAGREAALFHKHPGEFIPCIGAAIHPIDFIPEEFAERRRKPGAVILTAIFLTACIAGSLGIVYAAYSDYLEVRQQLEAAERELADISQINAVYEKYDNTQKALQEIQELEEALPDNDFVNAVITELERKLPDGAAINTLQFSDGGISVSGVADNNGAGVYATIIKICRQIEEISYFDTVQISSLAVVNDAADSEASFTIDCTYAGGNYED